MSDDDDDTEANKTVWTINLKAGVDPDKAEQAAKDFTRQKKKEEAQAKAQAEFEDSPGEQLKPFKKKLFKLFLAFILGIITILFAVVTQKFTNLF